LKDRDCDVKTMFHFLFLNYFTWHDATAAQCIKYDTVANFCLSRKPLALSRRLFR